MDGREKPPVWNMPNLAVWKGGGVESEETLSYAGVLMFKIGQFTVLK